MQELNNRSTAEQQREALEQPNEGLYDTIQLQMVATK